jgi:hypothetical protein
MHTEKTSPEPDPLGARYREYQPAATSLAGGFNFGLLLIAGGMATVAFALHGDARVVPRLAAAGVFFGSSD